MIPLSRPEKELIARLVTDEVTRIGTRDDGYDLAYDLEHRLRAAGWYRSGT